MFGGVGVGVCVRCMLLLWWGGQAFTLGGVQEMYYTAAQFKAREHPSLLKVRVWLNKVLVCLCFVRVASACAWLGAVCAILQQLTRVSLLRHESLTSTLE